MRLTTRPALLHWIVAGIVTAIVAVFVTFPIAALALPRVPDDRKLAALIGIYVLLWLAAIPLLLRSARAARWGVDLDGLDTPFGRIDFDRIASAHRGYPARESASATLLQAGSGMRSYMDSTLVLQLEDGSLLPINLLSPSIVGGKAVMEKLVELLEGKRLSNVFYTQWEIAALRKRPINQLIRPPRK